MAQSPIFLVGAPRSGTTWLQTMLGAHPEIASPQETDLVHGVLAPWDAGWNERCDANRTGDERIKGLPTVLDQAAFDDLLRHALATVHHATLDLKPSASVVLDKHPEHARHLPLIRRLVPDARVLHLVRDGRDVAASLVAASASWGRRWSPATIPPAALRWADHVRTAKAASADGHYLELRYEDLLTDGPATLARVLGFCEVDHSPALVRRLYDAFTFERMGDDATSTFDGVLVGGEAAALGLELREPEGFFRVGRPGAWRSWSDAERWAFDRAAGDLLIELGYEPDRSWAAPPNRVARAGRSLRLAVARLRAGVERQVAVVGELAVRRAA